MPVGQSRRAYSPHTWRTPHRQASCQHSGRWEGRGARGAPATRRSAALVGRARLGPPKRARMGRPPRRSRPALAKLGSLIVGPIRSLP
jgi:hypothetical protein